MHYLILGARAPASLEWARAIKQQGWQVTLADSLAWPLSRFSEAGKKYYRLPEPRPNPQAWINSVKKLVIDKKIDWIIPTCEEVFYLAWGASELQKHCQLLISDFSLLEELHHKYHFAKLTCDWHLQAPTSYLITNTSQIDSIFATHNEWVLKPVFSRFATHTLIKPSIAELKKIVINENSPWVMQHFIQGKEHCSYSLINNGEVISHACYHPKYRVGKGSGIYFDVTQPPEIQEFVKTFAQKTHYHGQVAFDFIEATNGKFYVLECNPRATSGIHLFNDQPEALTEFFEPTEKRAPLLTSSLPGGETVPSPGKGGVRVGSNSPNTKSIFQPTTNPRMSSMAMILFAMIKQGWKKTFWQDFKQAQDIISHSGEHRPHYAQLLCLTEMCTRAIIQRKGLLAAVTADIEWDGQPIKTGSNS